MPELKPSHCVICGHAGRGAASVFHMTHGVRVWLCDTHRHPRFLRRRNGRIFAERLEAAWDAAGAATVRRLQALASHVRRMDPEPVKPDLPGSYSWPMLRQLAEERFAAGEDPDTVIRELRALFDHETANVPSVRTMRRWHAQGRWIHTTDGATATPTWWKRPAWLRRPRVSEWPNLGYDTSLALHPFGWFLLLWVDDRPDHERWRRL